MYRIVKLFIIFIYLLPFTLLSTSKYIFEYWQVLTVLTAFLLGGFLIQPRKKLQPIDYKNYLIPGTNLLLGTFILYFIVNIHMFYDVFQHLFIYHDYAAWTLENTVKRYAGELDSGPLKKISSILFLMYMVFLGAYGFRENWEKYYFLLFIMLVVESSALARAGVLIGLVAYFSEFLIRNNFYFSTIKTKKMIKIGLLLFLVISIIFFFSAYLRIQNEENIYDILMAKLGGYILATYQALLIWMHNVTEYANTYGFSTFTGIYKIITHVQVKSGFYDSVQTDYGSTVIFTTLRGFLADFGYIVTVVLFFISGFLLKYFQYNRMGYISYFFIRTLLFILLYMLYSPFLFGVIVVGYFLSYFILIAQGLKVQNYRRRGIS